MIARLKIQPPPRAALDRIKSWTRTRFSLDKDATVFVSQITCTVPGCPPLETVVAFWTGGERRHHFKVFKPAAEVVEDDLPPSWMKNALIDEEVFGCECC
jgi:nitrate reductase delta subunit